MGVSGHRDTRNHLRKKIGDTAHPRWVQVVLSRYKQSWVGTGSHRDTRRPKEVQSDTQLGRRMDRRTCKGTWRA